VTKKGLTYSFICVIFIKALCSLSRFCDSTLEPDGDLSPIRRAILSGNEATARGKKLQRTVAVSVIIARHLCVLLTRERHPALRIDPERCVQCGVCLRLGCPAISKEEDQVRMDPLLCVGCGMCAEVCPRDAVVSYLDERRKSSHVTGDASLHQ